MAAWHQPLALTLGMVALTVRAPGKGAILLVCLVGLIGMIAPVPSTEGKASSALAIAITGLGMGAVYFVAGVGVQPALPAGALAAAATLAAAVGEEAFFRRLMYGWIAGWGRLLAVAVTALAFATVHLPLYGLEAFPLNLAAGLLFGWQRWASGGWGAPAATHAFANSIGMGVLG